jgi:hypothetical protein
MNWTKSSFSVDAANCVEFATERDVVHIRNSNHPARSTLVLPVSAMADFVRACAVGELDDLLS